MSSARSSSDSDDGLLKALSTDFYTGGSGANGCGFCGGCCALQRSRSHEVVTYKAHTAGTNFLGKETGDMCQGLNSHYFHIIGDGHQPHIRGL